jgi:signal transduction histidine kinase/DNA-binding response OmpR family regulator
MNVLLVISGNHAVCETLRNVLPASDLAIFEPAPESACRRLMSIQVDAVLLDDGPSIGVAAITALKAAVPHTPIIVLSTRGDASTHAEFIKAGADHVLSKPFSCEAIYGALENVSARRQALARPFLTLNPGSIAQPSVLNQQQMALRWLSRIANFADDKTRLAQSMVDAAMDIFDAVRCAVLLEGEDHVRVVASHGIPDSITGPLRLDYGSGLMCCFDRRASLVDREALQAFPEALKEMQLLHASMAVPLLRNGRVFGAVALGEKASGQDYTTEERELLTIMARSASMAFDRASAHEKVADRQTDLSSVFSQLPAGLITVSPDKTISRINGEAERLFDVRAPELIGRSVQKLGSAFADAVLRTQSDGQPRRQRIRNAATNTWLDLHTAPMEGGGIAVAVTEAVETDAPSEDIANSPFWEYLSSRVAQEIKNPMVAINTFAQLLPRKHDSPDFRDAFSRVVQTEVARINAVVETLFEFSRNPELVLERCNVNDTLRNILQTFEAELAERSIQMDIDLDPELLDAELDKASLAQAVESVVRNSMDAMPTGGKISITSKKKNGQAEIRIADSGPGMRAEDESRVFLPFYSTKERGMGLGLTIARRILREHQGELKLASNDEGGAAFALRFPVSDKGEKKYANDSGD